MAAQQAAMAAQQQALDAEWRAGWDKVIAWAGQNLRVVALATLFVVCGLAALVLDNTGTRGATQLYAVTSAAGATALGLLAPSPNPAGGG